MRRVMFLIAAAVAATAGSVQASVWQIDPAHSSAQFAVRHLMVSTVRGTLGKVTGTVKLDDTDLTQSSVDASVDATTIDTREPKRDAHLKSPDFFDVAAYPVITFKSKQVKKIDEGTFRVVGDLTLHGVTKEVALNVNGSPQPSKDPAGNVKVGGVATTRLNRKDFNISWNKSLDGGGVVVGDDVDVTIDVELIRQQP